MGKSLNNQSIWDLIVVLRRNIPLNIIGFFTDNCIEMIKPTVGLAGYDTINVTEINNSVLTLMSY